MSQAIGMSALLDRHGATLAPDEVRRLAQRIERGDESAREQLIMANLRLVASLVHDARGQRLEDLFQEGVLGLIRAVDLYDWRRGLQFSTYATWWIRRAIARGRLAARAGSVYVPERAQGDVLRVRALDEQRAGSGLAALPDAEAAAALGISTDGVRAARSLQPVTSDPAALAAIADPASTPQDAVEQTLCRDQVIAGVAALADPIERSVLAMRWGLCGGEGASLRQVARQLGLSHERVRQVERRALERLRPVLAHWED